MLSINLDKIRSRSHLGGILHAFDRLECAYLRDARVGLEPQARQPQSAFHGYSQSRSRRLAYAPALDRLAYVPSAVRYESILNDRDLAVLTYYLHC